MCVCVCVCVCNVPSQPFLHSYLQCRFIGSLLHQIFLFKGPRLCVMRCSDVVFECRGDSLLC